MKKLFPGVILFLFCQLAQATIIDFEDTVPTGW